MTTTESKAVTGGSDGEFPKSKGFKNVGTAPEFSSFDERERSIASNDVVFDATEDVRHYKPIDTYEGIHRWDPDFEWEREEEEKIVKKIDLRICTFACLTFFALQLDRGNIVQAVADNMLTDLNLNTNDYNTGQTIFYVAFLFAELPSQLISKKLGPDRWIPIQMVCWSLVASCQAFLTGKGSFFTCRALLGLLEGGFVPDTILFLSYWYKSKELPIRLGFFWMSFEATAIVGAFLAFGLLHIRGPDGTGGWRYLFALEGLLTGLVGIFAGFYMPPSPTQTAGRFRGERGWFNEREEKIMVNRVIRDDPGKGSMHNRQALTIELLWEAMRDYDLWPIYLLGLTWLVPPIPATTYITLQLKSLGFDTFQTNLLSIPAYVIFIINLWFWTWVSERFNQRLLLGVVAEVWNIVLLIALEVLPADAGAWGKWAILTLLVGSPYIHAIVVAITSRNAGSVRTRTVASALYNIAVQASNIIANNVYQDKDKPLYRTGNKVLIAIAIWSLLVFIAAKWYYVRQNKTRIEIWKAMTTQERDAYLATNKDTGNKRLDFRFAH